MHLSKDIFSPWFWRVQSSSGIVGFLTIHIEKYFSQLIFKMWISHKCNLKTNSVQAIQKVVYSSDGLGLLSASIHHHPQLQYLPKLIRHGKARQVISFCSHKLMFWNKAIRTLAAMHALLMDNMHHMIANCHWDYYLSWEVFSWSPKLCKKSDSSTIMSQPQNIFPVMMLLYNHCIF